MHIFELSAMAKKATKDFEKNSIKFYGFTRYAPKSAFINHTKVEGICRTQEEKQKEE